MSQEKLNASGNNQLDESQIHGSLHPNAQDRWHESDSEDFSIDLEEMPYPISKIKRIDKTNENKQSIFKLDSSFIHDDCSRRKFYNDSNSA